MSQMIKVLIIDRDAASRATIREAIRAYPECDVIAETENLIYGYELIRQNKPHVVFIEYQDDNAAKSLDIIERISIYFKNVVMFVVGNPTPVEQTLTIMRSGAREYLARPLNTEAVASIIQHHQQAFMVDSVEGDTTGRIVTVFSNKGGLGKTTISVNLALAISQVVSEPVVLVDLNLQLGDITTFLNISPKQTIVDLSKNIDRVDKAYLESSLARYQTENAQVYILADPLHVEDAEEVSAEQINTVLTIIKASFPYVVIDTNTSFDSKTLTALDIADSILLISAVNLPAVRSTQRVLSLFKRLGYDTEKVKLVLNRYDDNDEIDKDDIEMTLNKPVFWTIPNDYKTVITAINRGIPVALVEHGAMLTKNLLAFACKLTGVVGQDEKIQQLLGGPAQKGLLGNLFGKR